MGNMAKEEYDKKYYDIFKNVNLELLNGYFTF